ncbi:MAG: MGDG synthase family glycosyltransferase [Oscillochloridaceae bacterium umkhey_bin13]
MLKRVLILSASVGSGHKSAAAALEQVFRTYPGIEVTNQDALKLTSRIYQVTANDIYFRLVKQSPWYVGWIYDNNDEPFKNERGLPLLWQMLNGQPLAEFIEDYQPDLVVCTHFLPAGIATQLLVEERINARLAIITTDYDFQGMWLSKAFNRYFVALDETRAFLAGIGVEAERVTVSGIPVNPVFAEPFEAEAVRARYNLDPALPTLLVSAGALGGGPAVDIVNQIMAMQTPVQTIVVCGRNQALRQQVTTMTAARAEQFRVLGYSNEMPDLMRVATLFIGKPGGLTTAECMAANLPMVVIEPIPGQEERNSDHLLENGAALRCRSLPALGFKLDRALSEPGRIEAMRAGTNRLARPDAARTVVMTLLNDTTEPYHFQKDELRQIIAVARGEVEPEPIDEPPSPDEIALYHDDTGVYIGAINQDQLAFLIDQLEEEGLDDETYYLDGPTIDYLQLAGADDDLLITLRAAIEGRGQSEVRYVRS